MSTRPEGLCVECPRFEECPTKGDMRSKLGKLAYQLGEIMLIQGECPGRVYDHPMKEMLNRDPKCGNPNLEGAVGIMYAIKTYEWNKKNS